MTPEDYEQAACRGKDPAIFFPGRGESNAEAIAICHTCTVKSKCLQTALNDSITYGIWGGLSERQRRNRRRENRVRGGTYGTLELSKTAIRAREYRAKLKADANAT